MVASVRVMLELSLLASLDRSFKSMHAESELVEGTLPSFITIGAMKCGTSSIHKYLDLHPDISMSKLKEPDFFIKEKKWSKGVGWYRSQFRPGAMVGESSPNYTKRHMFSGVPKRMHDLLPDIKLIYLVRNPVERAISHYVHDLSQGRQQKSLNSVMSKLEGNHYLLTGLYSYQLEAFLEYYDREQLLIVFSSDLRDNRTETLGKVFRFLGVAADFESRSFQEEHHPSSSKKRPRKVIQKLARWAGPVTKLIPKRVRSMLREAKIDEKELTAANRQRLAEYFREDISRLEELTSTPIRGWN